MAAKGQDAECTPLPLRAKCGGRCDSLIARIGHFCAIFHNFVRTSYGKYPHEVHHKLYID
ncbi:hypothetical protein HMPREF3185_01630 [Porphyromonas somerae]|uniref:Uncharacterized protein n=1 Tax=Porphyromonas somerae TaxID=322095 RepID=A0A134B414_9PORP|nr:hypothetical protein HMPREF3184_01630 [Porphyromonadaceae bacterium KA00676]KXB74686.1 hypothetical protein HMPREF3185_01630 [Porphyromonas somerae]